MKYVYAVCEESELIQHKAFISQQGKKLHAFLEFLHNTYHVQDLPGTIVLTSEEIATRMICDIPVPAYTNDYRTVFCPDISTWEKIYLRQLQDLDSPVIRRYYETGLTENHILQILGHEFVHHSELFFDEAYEQARWFEEGMCEYISRKYFLTDTEFDEEARINAALVARYEKRFGKQALEEFTADTYSCSYEDIFFFYWKSFLTVNSIIEQQSGDLMSVFRSYRNWFDSSSPLRLTELFHIA